MALSAGAALLGIAVVGLIGFGAHALGFLDAVGEQQQMVATHSVPAETARLVGLSGTPSWWRHLFLAGFLVSVLYAMWRTRAPRVTQRAHSPEGWVGPGARGVGADWRVAAGWSTIALLVSTAWLLPWYAIWLLPLAAVSGDRRLRAATLVCSAPTRS